MSKIAPTEHLEYLKKQFRAGQVLAVVVSAIPDALSVADPGGARRFYVVDFDHRGRGWLTLKEARSRLKVRTWWKLDECVSVLRDAGFTTISVNLLARPLTMPTWPATLTVNPTRSARRRV